MSGSFEEFPEKMPGRRVAKVVEVKRLKEKGKPLKPEKESVGKQPQHKKTVSSNRAKG